MRKNTRIQMLLGTAAVGLALASMPARAQDAPVASHGARASADNSSKGNANDIVVTGTRVISNGNNSPSAVTVVTAAQMTQTSPTNLSDALLKMPEFVGSSSQANTQAGAGAFSASSFLNLRSLGPVRNLVLFDGMRLSPSSTTGAVDIYNLPEMLVQRVDVVTGGVSAVYGSDAVSGVVNFVIDKKFNGLKLEAQSGISQYGDDASQRFGIAGGANFAEGRGHVEASFEYFNSDGIDSNKDRPNGAARYTSTGLGTAASPFQLTSNSNLSALSFGGHILGAFSSTGAFNPAFYDTNFTTNGNLVPFVHGAATGTSGIESGGDGGYFASSLLATLRTKKAFLRVDYELTDTVNAHAQGFFTETDSAGTYLDPILGVAGSPSTYSAQNAFLSPALQQQMAAAGVASFVMLKFQTDVPPVVQATNVRNIFANAGFDGKFGSKFDWSIDYDHNESRRTDVIEGNQNYARELAAADAVVAPAGFTGSNFLLNSSGQKVVCNVTITNPGLYPGCLPLNLFGPSADNAAAMAWTRGNTTNVRTQKLDTVSATIKGTPFRLPAGDVRFAINAEWRRQTLVDNSSNQPGNVTDCTGLRFCTSGEPVWQESVVANVAASEDVKEISGEVLLPLLADKPFFKSLDFDGAVRYTDYSTSGGVTTWKAGLDWHLTDELSFRGTRSRDIRAPTLDEAFGAKQIAQSGYSDIQTQTTGFTSFVSQGNPNLAPEVANTLTIGGVYKPHWLPGFSVAIDYYNIKIDNAITLIDGRQTVYQQQCLGNPTSAYCQLYIRPVSATGTSAANYPTEVLSEYLNVAHVKTHGIDMDLIYKTPGLGGNWMFRVIGSYQPTMTQEIVPGQPILNNAGVDGIPKYRLTGFLSYAHGPITIATQTTWHSATRHSADPTQIYAYGDTPSKAFTDLNVTFDIPTATRVKPQFFVTVNNLFNTSPGIYPAVEAGVPGFGPIATNGDDPIGRYFTAGVRVRL